MTKMPHKLEKDPSDLFKIKNWLLWAQWMALICDAIAAVVAIMTFTDVTYCCGEPILNIAGTVPWKEMIRVLTYIYLGLVFMEVYPVVQKGIPVNLINPIVGFTITFAMFFSDTLKQALSMWIVESAAVICEYVLYRLKVRQTFLREKEIVEVGRKTQARRSLKDGEDPDAPARELSEARQKFYQLKQDQLTDNTLTWYLGVGCYLNIILGIAMLTLIIVVNRGGGLCIHDFKVPNPFLRDQLSSCPLCEGTTGTCEICTDDVEQCFYPYS